MWSECRNVKTREIYKHNRIENRNVISKISKTTATSWKLNLELLKIHSNDLTTAQWWCTVTNDLTTAQWWCTVTNVHVVNNNIVVWNRLNPIKQKSERKITHTKKCLNNQSQSVVSIWYRQDNKGRGWKLSKNSNGIVKIIGILMIIYQYALIVVHKVGTLSCTCVWGRSYIT